ncbi:MAG TPA: T9SS type A sorting domain-containing protein, partial [Niastella sp.]|nr:T9SS type A sorting domain-containing protein [Niastella sp.]
KPVNTVNAVLVEGSGSPIGLNETKGSPGFKIYPNPSSRQMVVEFAHTGNASALLYNMNGELMGTYTLDTGNTVIDLQAYKAGTYICVIRNGENVFSQKIVRSR